MTPNIKSVPESWTLQKFAAFLSENQITGSPVVDAEGAIVGVATLFDIADFHMNQNENRSMRQMSAEDQLEARQLRHLIFAGMANTPVEVRDIMTPQLVAVEESTLVVDVAALMIKEHVHRVFVRSDGKVTGIITTFDMLRLVADQPRQAG